MAMMKYFLVISSSDVCEPDLLVLLDLYVQFNSTSQQYEGHWIQFFYLFKGDFCHIQWYLSIF